MEKPRITIIMEEEDKEYKEEKQSVSNIINIEELTGNDGFLTRPLNYFDDKYFNQTYSNYKHKIIIGNNNLYEEYIQDIKEIELKRNKPFISKFICNYNNK